MSTPSDAMTGELTVDQEGGHDSGSARQILETADADRRRFTRDLHDAAQQKFVAAMNNLRLAQARFASEPERAKRHLDAALTQAESGLRALRDLVAGIHPPVLAHLGLQAAVESLADDCPIPVSLDITDGRLPVVIEESVYFFVSEALTNVIKHARASEAKILIAAGETLLTVEVSDDGVGGASMTDDGSGLPGLMHRVQALDGELTLASPPTGGTVLRGVLPLPG
ncbi:MAG: histidine kinase [Solirubrobacteraceae bacterium]